MRGSNASFEWWPEDMELRRPDMHQLELRSWPVFFPVMSRMEFGLSPGTRKVVRSRTRASVLQIRECHGPLGSYADFPNTFLHSSRVSSGIIASALPSATQ